MESELDWGTMMEEKEKVSVVIPVYNEVDYLEPCVFSVCGQTYRNLEILLIDDGSDNGAEMLCEEYKKWDPRITVIHKKNGGLSEARVTGILYATGDWIMFVDDDDIVAENFVTEMMRHRKEKGLDVIAGGRIDADRAKSRWLGEEDAAYGIWEGKEVCERIGEDRQRTIITPLWGKLYRAEFLKEFPLKKYKKICPTIFFEDVLITPILYYYARKICIVFSPYYFHREVVSSISRSGRLSSFYYEQIYSGDLLLKFCKKKSLSGLYRHEVNKYMESIIRIHCLMDKSCESYKAYRKEICHRFWKHCLGYLRHGAAAPLKKLIILSYGFLPDLFRLFARKFYFKA